MNIEQARAAAERLREHKYEPDCKLDVCWQQLCDFIDVKEAFLALLADPCELLAEPVWTCSTQDWGDGNPPDQYHRWLPTFMSYGADYIGEENQWKWTWCRDEYYDEGSVDCDSLESAKAACVADYHHRMRSAFR